MNSEIQKVLSVFRSFPELDEEGVFRKLVSEGLPASRAARLLEFIPIVYCRLMLRPFGAQFSGTFRRKGKGGIYEERPFASDALWEPVNAFARSEVDQGISKQAMLLVAGRSPEFDAANQLLNRGSKLEDLRFAPPVFLWPENGPL
jgi:hypothetical protein